MARTTQTKNDTENLILHALNIVKSNTDIGITLQDLSESVGLSTKDLTTNLKSLQSDNLIKGSLVNSKPGVTLIEDFDESKYPLPDGAILKGRVADLLVAVDATPSVSDPRTPKYKKLAIAISEKFQNQQYVMADNLVGTTEDMTIEEVTKFADSLVEEGFLAAASEMLEFGDDGIYRQTSLSKNLNNLTDAEISRLAKFPEQAPSAAITTHTAKPQSTAPTVTPEENIIKATKAKNSKAEIIKQIKASYSVYADTRLKLRHVVLPYFCYARLRNEGQHTGNQISKIMAELLGVGNQTLNRMMDNLVTSGFFDVVQSEGQQRKYYVAKPLKSVNFDADALALIGIETKEEISKETVAPISTSNTSESISAESVLESIAEKALNYKKLSRVHKLHGFAHIMYAFYWKKGKFHANEVAEEFGTKINLSTSSVLRLISKLDESPLFERAPAQSTKRSVFLPVEISKAQFDLETINELGVKVTGQIVTTDTKSETAKAPEAEATKAPVAEAPAAKAQEAKAPTAKAPTAKAPTAKTPEAEAPTAKAAEAEAPTAKATEAPTAKAPEAKATGTDMVQSEKITAMIKALAVESQLESSASAGDIVGMLESLTQHIRKLEKENKFWRDNTSSFLSKIDDFIAK
ncbi:hypothetical protein AB4254_11310 [Vibrio breoganii]